MSYQGSNRLNFEGWVTDPKIPDPENIPIPLGWNILIRPYPMSEKTTAGIILSSETKDFAANITNIGRVVAIGPCSWSRSYHTDKDGNRFDWVKVGDFVSFPKFAGHKRKYKGVSFIILGDDEITDLLPDPLVFKEQGMTIDIPKEDLEKYNTVYNSDYTIPEVYKNNNN